MGIFDELDTSTVKPANPANRRSINPACQLSNPANSANCANEDEQVSRVSTISTLADRRLHIGRVLLLLDDAGLFRDGDQLKIRRVDCVSQEQRQLINDYHDELLEALTPRGLTPQEAAVLAIYMDDIGEFEKQERDYAFNIAERTPVDRIAMLRLATGSPDYQE